MASFSLFDDFFSSLQTYSVEDRVIDYIKAALRRGRSIQEVLDDDYVRSRISQSQRENLLSRSDIAEIIHHKVVDTFDELKRDTH